MKTTKLFWLVSLICGIKIQKPVRRIKRTRSVKYHFLAKGLAKKSNPYKRKTRLFKKRKTRLFKKKRSSKKSFKLFKLRRR